jgi:hypothetical protein
MQEQARLPQKGVMQRREFTNIKREPYGVELELELQVETHK